MVCHILSDLFLKSASATFWKKFRKNSPSVFCSVLLQEVLLKNGFVIFSQVFQRIIGFLSVFVQRIIGLECFFFFSELLDLFQALLKELLDLFEALFKELLG